MPVRPDLIRADCDAGLRLLRAEGRRYDLVMSCPFLRTGGRPAADEVARELAGVADVLGEAGSVLVLVPQSAGDPGLSIRTLALLPAATGLVCQNLFAWVSSIELQDRRHGKFRPISGSRYAATTHGHVLHLSPAGDARISDDATTAIWAPFSRSTMPTSFQDEAADPQWITISEAAQFGAKANKISDAVSRGILPSNGRRRLPDDRAG